MVRTMIALAGGIFGTWYFARQLYTAAMRDFIMTGMPETRHYRAEHPILFRNNVIAAIFVLPMVVAGGIWAVIDLIGLVAG